MNRDLISSPHLRVQPSVRGVMLRVLGALLPGIAVCTGLFGPGVLLNLLWCISAAVLTEVLVMALRGRSWRVIGDGSAVLTGALLALALPPDAPWWLPVLGGLFAVAWLTASAAQARCGAGHAVIATGKLISSTT